MKTRIVQEITSVPSKPTNGPSLNWRSSTLAKVGTFAAQWVNVSIDVRSPSTCNSTAPDALLQAVPRKPRQRLGPWHLPGSRPVAPCHSRLWYDAFGPLGFKSNSARI